MSRHQQSPTRVQKYECIKIFLSQGLYFIHSTLEGIIGFGGRQDRFERGNISEICAGELFIGGRCCLTSDSRL